MDTTLTLNRIKGQRGQSIKFYQYKKTRLRFSSLCVFRPIRYWELFFFCSDA